MDTKVYTCKKKYVAADGTIRYYNNSSKYKPVDKTNKVTHKDLIEIIRNIKDKEKLREIKEILSKINGGEIGNNQVQ